MFTEAPPRSAALLAQFHASDELCELKVPGDERLRAPAKAIELAMTSGTSATVREACAEFLRAAADFYGIPTPEVRVLAARPIRVREGGWATELFGDYAPQKMLIRVWMRTAVQQRVTSLGTFLSTLCHEFCHHLDAQGLGFRGSPHTRGFYSRTAVLYHHARGTPLKRLIWARMRDGCWRIDWPATNRG